MKNLIILGAGGMGKTIYSIATNSIGYCKEFVVKGFLDYPNNEWNTDIYPPILGFEDDYEIQSNDVFVCSIGDVHIKRKICEKMESRGAQFYTLISQKANIRHNVIIGEGTIIAEYASIGNDTIIGKNVLVQSFANIAHDCYIGDYSRLDVRSMLVGGVIVGKCVTVHTASVLSHKVIAEDDSKVGAMSLVLKRVRSGTTVFGMPAKVIEL